VQVQCVFPKQILLQLGTVVKRYLLNQCYVFNFFFLFKLHWWCLIMIRARSYWSFALCSDGYDICVHMVNFQVLFRNYLELLLSLSLSLSLFLYILIGFFSHVVLHHNPKFHLYHTQNRSHLIDPNPSAGSRNDLCWPSTESVQLNPLSIRFLTWHRVVIECHKMIERDESLLLAKKKCTKIMPKSKTHTHTHTHCKHFTHHNTKH